MKTRRKKLHLCARDLTSNTFMIEVHKNIIYLEFEKNLVKIFDIYIFKGEVL